MDRSDSHLYVWTTNAIVPFSVECMSRWGFEHKSIITWIKPRFRAGRQTLRMSQFTISELRSTREYPMKKQTSRACGHDYFAALDQSRPSTLLQVLVGSGGFDYWLGRHTYGLTPNAIGSTRAVIVLRLVDAR